MIERVSDKTRVLAVLAYVMLVMTVSTAGVLSGAGIFIISIVAKDATSIVLSSLLFSFSLATTLLCYAWFTS